MHAVRTYVRDLVAQTASGWNRFWFTPADPATLGLLRILGGAMLFYTHLVWSLDLEAFFGPVGWLNAETSAISQDSGFAWSHLWWCQSPGVLWGTHLASLLVFLLLTVGLFSRTMSVVACLLTISYANRAAFALFGLDQVNGFIALYLMLGPCGAAYSIDRWRLRRRLRSQAGAEQANTSERSIGANIAMRLVQLHLCVLYLFAGLSKLQGPAWWDGTAMWKAMANLEYQSLDMTWMSGWPLLVNVLTHVTIAWEISYCALIWPRMTRPLVLLLALPLHLGIALCLGMTTFGVIMLVANLSFVSPELVRVVISSLKLKRGRADERTLQLPDNRRRSSTRKSA